LIDEVKDKLTEDLKPADVEMAVKIYNNLKFKSNIPTEVIEYVDKTLIQVSSKKQIFGLSFAKS
jgi:hypothetical protein